MLRNQFIVRTVIVVILGVLFVYGAIWQAGNCPAEEVKKRSWLRIVLAVFCTIISAWAIVCAVADISSMPFPVKMLPEAYTTYPQCSIIRPSSVHQVWGPPTIQQFSFFSFLNGAIMFFAIACYLFFYERSNSKWWAKTLKVLNFVLAYTILTNLTFVYFDLWEFLPLLVCASLLAFNILIVGKFGYR